MQNKTMTLTDAPTWTIPRRRHDGPARLSFGQERLFLLDRIMPGLAAYNVPALVRVRCTLDAELVRRACEMIIARHEILRTTIRLVDGTPAQEVMPLTRFELTVADLRRLSEAGRDARAHELLAELARRPFDLARDVLLRVALVHVGVEEDLLLIVTPGISERDVLANLTTPAFDLSVPDWYLPLTTGARLVIVPREATLDGVNLADWLTRSGATFVRGPSSNGAAAHGQRRGLRLGLRRSCIRPPLTGTITVSRIWRVRIDGALWDRQAPGRPWRRSCRIPDPGIGDRSARHPAACRSRRRADKRRAPARCAGTDRRAGP